MKLWNKLKNWVTGSDEEKVQLDRRAFLKGMAVTSAGLVVPGALTFDMGRKALVEPAREILEADYSGFEQNIQVYLNGIMQREGDDYTLVHEEVGFEIHPRSGLYLPDDRVSISYTAKTDKGQSILITGEELGKDMKDLWKTKTHITQYEDPFGVFDGRSDRRT